MHPILNTHNARMGLGRNPRLCTRTVMHRRSTLLRQMRQKPTRTKGYRHRQWSYRSMGRPSKEGLSRVVW
jgi:hypothetical protein